jgi:ABC-type Zn uptake system ZnuABC Zn-binding protein ZnuA
MIHPASPLTLRARPYRMAEMKSPALGVKRRAAALAGGILFVSSFLPCACSRQEKGSATDGKPMVIAVESFLADVAGKIAGDRLAVEALLPVGADPHEYEPVPRDVARVAGADLLIVNGAGFEGFLDQLLRTVGGQGIADANAGKPKIAEASQGLAGRTATRAGEVDPHFFLNPLLMVKYVENIRDEFCLLDATGTAVFRKNADAYIGELVALDRWIAGRVEQIPAKNRKLVTNHESLGYFADRYGLEILGAILPSVSSDASPSARQLAELSRRIKDSGVKAIFLEAGSSSKLAEQVALEAGVKSVTGLYTHSLSEPQGPAPTYIDMMRFDTNAIVEGLR